MQKESTTREEIFYLNVNREWMMCEKYQILLNNNVNEFFIGCMYKLIYYK